MTPAVFLKSLPLPALEGLKTFHSWSIMSHVYDRLMSLYCQKAQVKCTKRVHQCIFDDIPDCKPTLEFHPCDLLSICSSLNIQSIYCTVPFLQHTIK